MPFGSFRNYYPFVFKPSQSPLVRLRFDLFFDRFGLDMKHLRRVFVYWRVGAPAHPHGPEDRIAAGKQRDSLSHGPGDLFVDEEFFELLGAMHPKRSDAVARLRMSNDQGKIQPRQVEDHLISTVCLRSVRPGCVPLVERQA